MYGRAPSLYLLFLLALNSPSLPVFAIARTTNYFPIPFFFSNVAFFQDGRRLRRYGGVLRLCADGLD